LERDLGVAVVLQCVQHIDNDQIDAELRKSVNRLTQHAKVGRGCFTIAPRRLRNGRATVFDKRPFIATAVAAEGEKKSSFHH
jgi:hypothetical protein